MQKMLSHQACRSVRRMPVTQHCISARRKAVAADTTWDWTPSTSVSGGETTTEILGRNFFAPFGSGGTVTGFTAPGWKNFREGFEENFRQNLELGAQLVVYHGDSVVVDITGYSSKQLEYTADTLQCVYSSGKNMEAVALAMLVDRGLVKYEDTVAKHWPEFAHHGKGDITLADVMRHEAGLSYFSRPGEPRSSVIVTKGMLKDLDALETTIADSGLNMPVGERCYHALTRGWIISAVLRRVDPKQRSLGAFIRDEINEPLGITYLCGIPEAEQSDHNLAELVQPPKIYSLACEILPAMTGFGDPTLGAVLQLAKDKDSMFHVPTVEWMQQPATPAFNNSQEGRSAEIPSAGMYTNARSMAKVNACMANAGRLGNVRILSEQACADSMALATSKQDVALKWRAAFSQGGFGAMGSMSGEIVDPSIRHFCDGFFGWGGWGGSLSMWNPEKRIALSYTMTGMSNNLLGGPRCKNLLGPLADKIAK